MRTVLLQLSLFSCLAASFGAQSSQPVTEITTTTPTTPQMLHQWLTSGDPRLIAWAAYFTEATHDQQMLPEIEYLLEHWPAPAIRNHEKSQREQRMAALALLDALIRAGEPVPVRTIEAVAASFPDQAILLAHALPLEDVRQLFHVWMRREDGGWSDQRMALAAAMMLAAKPDPAFVAQIVNEAQEEMAITVIFQGAAKEGLGRGGSMSCGDSLGRPDSTGWPVIYTYDLDQNQSQGTELLHLGEDTIQYFRHQVNGGWGSCGGLSLTPWMRHHILAYMLDIPPEKMPWSTSETRLIVWEGKAAYEQQLGHILEGERTKLQQTVLELRQRGLLLNNEYAMPRLSVTIQCSVDPCPVFQ